MIDNRAGLTISTKAIGPAEQNWMLEVSDGGRNSITSESDNLFTNISSWDTLCSGGPLMCKYDNIACCAESGGKVIKGSV